MNTNFYFYLGHTRRLFFQHVGTSATITEQHLRVHDGIVTTISKWVDCQQWAGIPDEVESKPVKENSGTSNVIPLLSVPQCKPTREELQTFLAYVSAREQGLGGYDFDRDVLAKVKTWLVAESSNVHCRRCDDVGCEVCT